MLMLARRQGEILVFTVPPSDTPTIFEVGISKFERMSDPRKLRAKIFIDADSSVHVRRKEIPNMDRKEAD